LAPAVWLASLGAFLCSLDSALNVAFPAISRAFGVAPDRIALLIVFYHVPIGLLTVLGGLLGDRFGHRRVFACGVWTSAVAFPLCGLAPDYAWLLAGRAVQGVGAGLVFGTAPALVTLALSLDRRAPGLGMLNLAAGAGAVAPLLAGVLVDAFGWRAVFLFRVPLALATGAVSLAPLLAARPETAGARDVPAVSLRLVLGAALVVAANVASFSIYVFGPYYLVDVVRRSATGAGVLFMLVPLSMAVGGLAGGWLTRRIRAERLVVTGLALEAAGAGAIATLDAASGTLAIAGAFALTGWGLGLFQVPNMALVMAALPDRSQGFAGGTITAMRTVGIVTTSLVAPWFFALRAAHHGVAAPAARFAAAFSDTFLVSAVIATGAVGLALWLARATSRAPRPPGTPR
jgi:MFS family permease